MAAGADLTHIYLYIPPRFPAVLLICRPELLAAPSLLGEDDEMAADLKWEDDPEQEQ